MVVGSAPETMQWFPVQNISVFNAVLPKGWKVTASQYWFSALSLAFRDFSGFSESFNDIMYPLDEQFGCNNFRKQLPDQMKNKGWRIIIFQIYLFWTCLTACKKLKPCSTSDSAKLLKTEIESLPIERSSRPARLEIINSLQFMFHKGTS